MRKTIVLFTAALFLCACDPRLRRFSVAPAEVCPGETVHIEWEATRGASVRVHSNVPTEPPLEPPTHRGHVGTADVRVLAETEIGAAIPGGHHLEQRVRIRRTSPGASMTSIGTCAGRDSVATYAPVSLTGISPGLGVASIAISGPPVFIEHGGIAVPLTEGGPVANPFPGQPALGEYRVTPQSVIACGTPHGSPPSVPPVIITIQTGCR